MKRKSDVSSLIILISLLVFLLTAIPFNLNNVQTFEWIIKFGIFSGIALAIAIYALIHRIKYIGNNELDFIIMS